MKGSIPLATSAYVFVLMIMLTMFLLMTSVMGITASSRRTSAHYMQFAGLYDLALAGNERILLLLKQEQNHNSQEMINRVHERLLNEGIEAHLIFDGQSDNGNFYLGTHFWQMFMDEKDAVINNFLTNSFGRRSYYPPEDPARSFQGYYFSYNLIITANSYYTVSTYFAEGLRNDNIRTIAHKSINEQPGEAVRVYGQIRWPNPAHRVEILPLAYTWRAEPPIRFTTGTYPNASAVFGDFGMLSSLSWKPNNAVYIVQSTWLDLNDFSGVPTLIIYNGSSPLHLHGGTTFNGIIVAAGDVIIDNMAIRGSVISNGSIYLNNSLIEPDPYMLFSIPMHEEIRRLIFDFFKITSFNDATGRTEDVLNILGYVKISDFDLDTIPLEYFIPQLIEVQQVAN